MSALFPDIPKKLEEWSLEILNRLVGYRDIERDIFDFKDVPSELAMHISAMANIGGGTIVLGIEEKRSETGYLLGFTKKGFAKGQENKINNKVGNEVYKTEPIPKIESRHLEEDGRLYPILIIKSEESKKPYMVRDKANLLTFIRVTDSTRPANRSTILNLCTNHLQRKTEIERLRTAFQLMKDSVAFTSYEIKISSPESPTKIPPIDTMLIRNAILSADWFLSENNLYGKIDEKSSAYWGLNIILHKIERLNTYIQIYNHEDAPNVRIRVSWPFQDWKEGETTLKTVFAFLDKAIASCSDHLLKIQS